MQKVPHAKVCVFVFIGKPGKSLLLNMFMFTTVDVLEHEEGTLNRRGTTFCILVTNVKVGIRFKGTLHQFFKISVI